MGKGQWKGRKKRRNRFLVMNHCVVLVFIFYFIYVMKLTWTHVEEQGAGQLLRCFLPEDMLNPNPADSRDLFLSIS